MMGKFGLAMCALLALASSSWADTLLGKVIAVADGDTLTVLDASNSQFKIRLMGIDAPEKAMPYGERCKQSLSEMAFGKSASVEWSKHDRYGRIVGKVLVDGQDVNLAQLKRGCGWHYKKYAGEQAPLDRAAYSNAEIEARQTGQGLWADPSPVPPWDWRHQKR